MTISTRIALCYLTISVVCFYYPFDWVLDNMRTRYLEGVEDPLVDQANSLAEIVGGEMERGTFGSHEWQAALQRAYGRQVGARIYDLEKETVDMIVYMTDNKGRVLLHSVEPSNVGKDYANWRDVRLTLEGEYGARASRNPWSEKDTSILYVAAPILVKGELKGVLSVGKPTTNITWFLENARFQIVAVASAALFAAAILGFFVARWIAEPINRLTDYAKAVTNGRRVAFPQLGGGEIGEMGEAFRQMQETLEGKRYAEQYVQNLTHEIKSPLSAIRAAAELLDEPMEEAQRKRFFANIRGESLRIQKIVDRMLELAALESRRNLTKRERVSVTALVKAVLERMEPVLAQKKIRAVSPEGGDIQVIGDGFLLHQALENLLQNAVDFSPERTTIQIVVQGDETMVHLAVLDEGTGLADFSKEKIFNKFYSLPRPDTNRKSTGLGLNFVREVAQLHGGSIHLENRQAKGTKAVLSIERGVGRLVSGRGKRRQLEVG